MALQGRPFGLLLFSLLLLSLFSSGKGEIYLRELADEDSIGCSPCDPGTSYDPTTMANQTQDKCSGCDEGECFTGKQCYSCPNGTAQDQYGQSSCVECPTNFISGENGTQCQSCGEGTQPDSFKTSCENCQSGWFNNISSGGACQPCIAGSFAPNASLCAPCGSGTYNPSQAQKVCRGCGPGYYNPRPGSTLASSCLACTPGTYCKAEATSAPIVCPQNTYCPSRSSQPLPCGWLSHSHVGAAECEYRTAFYVVIGVFGLLVFLLIAFSVVFFMRKRETVVESPDKAELIPQSLPGPVYSGY